MSMSYCTSKILIKIVYLYKHKRNIQGINIVKILDYQAIFGCAFIQHFYTINILIIPLVVFVQIYDFNENFRCTI